MRMADAVVEVIEGRAKMRDHGEDGIVVIAGRQVVGFYTGIKATAFRRRMALAQRFVGGE